MKATVQQKKSQPNKKKGKGANVNIRQATSSLSVYGRPNANNGGPVRTLPAAMGAVKISGRPKMQPVGTAGDTRITHREYLGEVLVSNAFNSAAYPINPGQSTTFPWLSLIAGRFESYRFNALRFCYETESSSQKAGTVALTVDYDPQDAPPTTKVAALAYRNSARAQPWLSFTQTSSKEDLSKMKSYFVRQVTSAPDLRVTDVGNLFVITQGGDGTVGGELWVEYDVVLMTPQYNSAAGGSLTTDTYARFTGGITSSAVFGPGFSSDPGTGTNLNNLGLTVLPNQINFPAPGAYSIHYAVNTTIASAPSILIASASNVNITSYDFGDMSSDQSPTATMLMLVSVVVGSGGGSLAFVGSGAFISTWASLYVSVAGPQWGGFTHDWHTIGFL